MKNVAENSKAQVSRPEPCCNHGANNCKKTLSDDGSTVNGRGWTVPDHFMRSLRHPADAHGEPRVDLPGYGLVMAVAEYLDVGVSVFPCDPNGKRPLVRGGFKGATRDIEQAVGWWKKFHLARIGMPTGAENGILVLDIDQAKGEASSGFGTLAELESKYGMLPGTYSVSTPSGGEHRYFKMPNRGIKSTAGRVGVGLDIRADGGYIIAAGSSGYRLRCGKFGHFAKAPEWLIRLASEERTSAMNQPASSGTAMNTFHGDGAVQLQRFAEEVFLAPKGQRHTTIVTKANAAGYLVRDGLVTREQVATVFKAAIDRMDFSPEERNAEYKAVEDGIEYAFRDENRSNNLITGSKLGEAALVSKLTESYGEGNLVSDGCGLWKWTPNGVWRQVHVAEPKLRMSQFLGKYASNGLIKNAAELANAVLYSETFAGRQVPVFINCPNGELWWKEKHWQFYPEHNRENLATMQISVVYDPAASCPAFDQYLATTFGHEEAGQQMMQSLLEMTGYTLLPTCDLQKSTLLYGVPASGKSVYLELLGMLVGAKSHTAIPLSKLNKEPNSADLLGKLLHTVGDLDAREKIPLNFLKSIISGDMMSTRWLYGNAFNFKATSTLWIATNALPFISDFNAIERRVVLVEFTRTIPREQQDYRLLDKFKGELSGILNKALNAFGDVLKRNGVFTESEGTRKIFELWGNSSDDMKAFVDECCVVGPTRTIAFNQLYEAYALWAKRGNIRIPVPANKLTIKLKEVCNIEPRRSGETRRINGLDLKTNWLADGDSEPRG